MDLKTLFAFSIVILFIWLYINYDKEVDFVFDNIAKLLAPVFLLVGKIIYSIFYKDDNKNEELKEEYDKKEKEIEDLEKEFKDFEYKYNLIEEEGVENEKETGEVINRVLDNDDN